MPRGDAEDQDEVTAWPPLRCSLESPADLQFNIWPLHNVPTVYTLSASGLQLVNTRKALCLAVT